MKFNILLVICYALLIFQGSSQECEAGCDDLGTILNHDDYVNGRFAFITEGEVTTDGLLRNGPVTQSAISSASIVAGDNVEYFTPNVEGLFELNNLVDYTFMCWIKINGYQEGKSVISYFSTEDRMVLKMEDHKLKLQIDGNTVKAINFASSLTDRFNHIAITRDYNQKIILYINGIPRGSFPGPNSTATIQPYIFGADGASAIIDGILIKDGLMTMEQVQCHYRCHCDGEGCVDGEASCDGEEREFLEALNSDAWEQPSPAAGVPLGSVESDCKNDEGEFIFDDQTYVWVTGDHTMNGETTVVEQCWLITEAQECYNELGNLDDEGYHVDPYTFERTYGDITNSCRYRNVDGEIIYDFLISYQKEDETPYLHKDNCAEHQINFVKFDDLLSDYVPGESDESLDDRQRFNIRRAETPLESIDIAHEHDVFFWNPETLQLFMSIDHEHLVDMYGCEYMEFNNDNVQAYYQWLCILELNVIFNGEIQLTYEFVMTVTLDRILTAVQDLTIVRNVVKGDCCENKLEIDSSLHFCSNWDCVDDNGDDYLETISDYENGIKTVERRHKFYVAHRIDTFEFQHYFLLPLSLKIGVFIPKIHRFRQKNSTVTFGGQQTTNLLIYEVESAVALKNMRVTSIVLLNDNTLVDADNADADPFPNPPGMGRRSLVEVEVEDGYKMSAGGQMSINDPNDKASISSTTTTVNEGSNGDDVIYYDETLSGDAQEDRGESSSGLTNNSKPKKSGKYNSSELLSFLGLGLMMCIAPII